VDVDREELKQAYFQTRYLPPKQLDSMLQMLTVFAEHLSIIGNGIMVQRQNAEPPMVTRAKDYIQQNHTEHLSLEQVATAVNMSTFYFCKMFKKATGMNFTHHVSRVRIERARNLLLNRNLRISEIAYEVGFQSLTHFNRVFNRVLGQSPTVYRKALPAAGTSKPSQTNGDVYSIVLPTNAPIAFFRLRKP